MTVAVPAAPVTGWQRPWILARPPHTSSAAAEAIDIGASVGLHVDQAQRLCLDVMLAENGRARDGAPKWASTQTGILMGRQNGKGMPFDLAELHALIILKEPQIIHSAHQFSTATKAFKRMAALFDNYDHLRKHVKRIRRSHGEEGIELRNPTRELNYVARSRGAGRGWSAQSLFLDEAQDLPVEFLTDLLPTMRAQPNPRAYFSGTVPKPGERAATFTSLRNRGRAAFDRAAGVTTAGGVAWLEWSSGREMPESDAARLAFVWDPVRWAMSNPALGDRIDPAYMAVEMETFLEDPDFGIAGIMREIVLCWPDSEAAGDVPKSVWEARFRADITLSDPVVLGVEVSPDQDRAAIVGAGWTDDGKVCVDPIDFRHGTRWVPARLAELAEKWEVAAIVLDGTGPATSLLPYLEDADIDARTVIYTAAEVLTAAKGWYADLMEPRTHTDSDDGGEVSMGHGEIVHAGDMDFQRSVLMATRRPVGDNFRFERRSGADSARCVAATLSRQELISRVPRPESVYDQRGLIIL